MYLAALLLTASTASGLVVRAPTHVANHFETPAHTSLPEPPSTPGEIPAGNPPPFPNPYPRTGNLTQPPVKPFMPAGGVNVNRTDIPVYEPFSDFDYQSLALALYQEWIELDLFNEGLKRFSDEEFEEAGINATDRSLIQIMGNQEIGLRPRISASGLC